MDWKPYLKDRLIAEHRAGFYVIKPKHELSQSQPIFCPLCERIMNSHYDNEAYEKFCVCDLCSSKWARPDPARWESGWRPSKEDLNKS
jgi:hypothetical protein